MVLLSGGPVPSESGEEEERKVAKAAGAQEAQRSRTPGSHASRHPGGMHAQTLLLTWRLHSPCPLHRTTSLWTPSGSLTPQAAFCSQVTLSERPQLTTLSKRACNLATPTSLPTLLGFSHSACHLSDLFTVSPHLMWPIGPCKL